MKRKLIIASSVLSANFSKISKELDELEKANIKMIHYDVMDGHFVDNISFGPKILKDFSNYNSDFYYDVHLMIYNPSKYVDEFIKAGADCITFHHEIFEYKESRKLINYIKKAGIDVGISIKPKTNVEQIYEFLSDIDIILVMSVEPGFGGQKYIESSTEKILKLRKYIDNQKLSTLISVDGGINDETAKIVIDAGVDILVTGSYIFSSKNYKEKIDKLK